MIPADRVFPSLGKILGTGILRNVGHHLKQRGRWWHYYQAVPNRWTSSITLEIYTEIWLLNSNILSSKFGKKVYTILVAIQHSLAEISKQIAKSTAAAFIVVGQ